MKRILSLIPIVALAILAVGMLLVASPAEAQTDPTPQAEPPISTVGEGSLPTPGVVGETQPIPSEAATATAVAEAAAQTSPPDASNLPLPQSGQPDPSLFLMYMGMAVLSVALVGMGLWFRRRRTGNLR